VTFQVRKKVKSADEINLFNFKQTLKRSQLKSGKMKNYLIYILALLTIIFTSCSVNEELVMLDEVDDVYIQPDDRFYATASASTNDNDPVMEPMPGASDAEMSYYQNSPYSADDNAAEEDRKEGQNDDEEYYDYYDEDYASRLQNFHGDDNPEYYTYGGNNYYGGNNFPATSSWPRFNWSMNYGFSSFGYGARSGFGLGMTYGNPYNSFYDPFYDPFYSSWNNPYMSPWNRPMWGSGWGMGFNYGWGNPWGNPYCYGNPYNPYWGWGAPNYIDGSPAVSFPYNNQPTSRRRSRGGIVSSGSPEGTGGSNGSGVVAGGSDNGRDYTRRSASSPNAQRERSSGDVYSRQASSRNESTLGRERNSRNSERYVRPQRNSGVSNYTRSRVAPYTRERSVNRTRTNRSNSLYNNSPRMRNNNSYYNNPSRSRSSSPSYSSPSRSRSTSSPSRSTGTRRR